MKTLFMTSVVATLLFSSMSFAEETVVIHANAQKQLQTGFVQLNAQIKSSIQLNSKIDVSSMKVQSEPKLQIIASVNNTTTQKKMLNKASANSEE